MRIQIKGRNVAVSDELRDHVEARFAKIARQVSELARLEVVVWQERNPANPEKFAVEVALHVKGKVIVARDSSRTGFVHAVNLCCEELARQVKRDRVRRRHRREMRASKQDVRPAT